MRLTSAQVEARYMLLIVPNRMMKRQPKVRLISAHTRDMRAAVRVIGSYPISGTWNMVTMALQRKGSVQLGLIQRRDYGRAEKGRDEVEGFPLSEERVYEFFPGVLESC